MNYHYRYILDNADLVAGRRVLDVGCGCGAGAIAAAVRNARRVVANDIDPCENTYLIAESYLGTIYPVKCEIVLSFMPLIR